MAEKKQLGVFWGNDGLYFSETTEINSKQIFHIPFADKNTEGFKSSPLSSEGAALISDIQKVLREKKVTASTVNLSLPTKDIIFRSFIIPWMEEDEITSVVEFEASKYIPFPLVELSFAFHPITFTENNVKRIHIIFVAIKIDTLKNYTQILEEASLCVDIIEPAASSLIRILSLENLVPKDQTIALIDKSEEAHGRIIIINDEIPQFVREFSLLPTPDENEEAPEDTAKSLHQEVRISLDYFNRQNEQLHVTQIFLFTSPHSDKLSKELEKNLEMPITVIDDSSILKETSHGRINFLNAYGASIISIIDSPCHFNFSRKKSEPEKPIIPLPETVPINYKSLIKTALVCIPLMIIPIVMSGFWTQKLKMDINTFNKELGSFQDADISMIDQKNTILKSKLTYLEKTRIQSNVSLFLLLLPDLLPRGTWIKNIDIAYDDSKTFLLPDSKKKPHRTAKKITPKPFLITTLNGYAYSKNRNEQFRLINTLLRNLKNSKKFSDSFENINLESTQTKELDTYSVTAFTIVCEQNNEINRPK